MFEYLAAARHVDLQEEISGGVGIGDRGPVGASQELVPFQEATGLESPVELWTGHEHVGVLGVVGPSFAGGPRTTQGQSGITVDECPGNGPLPGTAGAREDDDQHVDVERSGRLR